jgi:hypothetical protein
MKNPSPPRLRLAQRSRETTALTWTRAAERSKKRMEKSQKKSSKEKRVETTLKGGTEEGTKIP